jgi:hypothetical protein
VVGGGGGEDVVHDDYDDKGDGFWWARVVYNLWAFINAHVTLYRKLKWTFDVVLTVHRR